MKVLKIIVSAVLIELAHATCLWLVGNQILEFYKAPGVPFEAAWLISILIGLIASRARVKLTLD